MIENFVTIIQGVLNDKPPAELQDKLHPMGVFGGMQEIMRLDDVQGGLDDVYRMFLVDTPIGPYFEEYLQEADKEKDGMAALDHSQVGDIITKQDLDIMKNRLKKAWLEGFYKFVQSMGG